MKILTLAELPGLPREAGELVADGVWSLYELEGSERSSPRYVLLTSRGSARYLLSSQGNPMPAVLAPDDFPFGAAVLLRSDRQRVRGSC